MLEILILVVSLILTGAAIVWVVGFGLRPLPLPELRETRGDDRSTPESPQGR